MGNGENSILRDPILRVKDLNVRLGPEGTRVVAGLDLTLRRNEILGVAGQSGAGKTQAALALLGLAGSGTGAILSGRIDFDGESFAADDLDGLARLRGSGLAMVTQESMASLTPVRSVGDLIEETLRASRTETRDPAQASKDLLEEVGFDDPERVRQSFAHQLSGGMRQRAAIALALAARPSVLIADEPTTALDMRIQTGIMALLSKLRVSRSMSILLISHDLAVIAQLSDRTLIMRAGRAVECGPTAELFASPSDPYTQEFLERNRARRIVGAT